MKANFIFRIWPFFVFILLSVGIIGATYTRDDSTTKTVESNVFAFTQPKQTTPMLTKQTINTSKPWLYTFNEKDSKQVDTTLFNVENGNETSDYNNELQTYTDRTDNVRVENDALVIEAKKESLNGKDYTSARLNTQGTFAFTYGVLQVEMKLPQGTGTWPAAWLMPDDPKYTTTQYGIGKNTPNAWALNGEIDFMEAVGYIPNQIIPATHSYNALSQGTIYTPGFIDDAYNTYHKYGVIKLKDSISFTIDGKVYATRTRSSTNPLDWPYDQPYYLILNLAIGGSWAGQKGIDASGAPWTMSVKSISYLPLAG
jgi:beta-glucanase (GH16 family)